MNHNNLFHSFSGLIVFLVSLFGIQAAIAQTGPGGVGNATGANSQPENIIWLDASSIAVANGANVANWTDLSNGEIFSASAAGGSNLPSYATSAVNGLPAVVFDDSNAERLKLNPFNNMASSEFTIMLVFSTPNTDEALLSYAIPSNSNEYLLFRAGNLSSYVNGNNNSGGAFNNGNFNILSTTWRSSDGQLLHFRNGANVNTGTISTGGSIANGGSLTIGGEQDAVDGNYAANQDLNGSIAEIIIYKNRINDAQRILIENYLSEKYNIALSSNDFFSLGDAAFDNEVTGIGTSNGIAKSSLSGFSDALQIEEANNSLDASNEFLLFAHDNTTHNETVTTELGEAEIDDRWARSWYVENSGTVSAKLRFDFGTAGFTIGSASDYVLLYRSSTAANYSRIQINSYTIENGDQLVVDAGNISLPTGYYTLGKGTQLVASNWYSFQTGNWNDPLTWTTDPSGALRVPGSGGLPTSGDNVKILNGRSVTMTTDNNDGQNLTVNGRLNIEQTTGHDFINILGNGTISIKGDGSNIDNFPNGATSVFADSIVGGTVEILGNSILLNQARVFNNVIINLDNATDVAILLSNYQINGDLSIERGDLQINNNSATVGLTITAYGNVTIASSGELKVGTANVRHEFNFYGDFSNNGRASFTNRLATNYNNEATDGIIDANFLSATSNQTIDCNGLTNFYRIEINKGTSQNYILDINSNSAANFNLYGPADYNHGSTAQLTTNDNALGLLRGTVRLNANVDIPVLNNGGNYNISEAARLWVNGGSAEKPSGTAIVPYGTIQLSDGIINAPINSGITTRANGNIVVSGGTLTVNQIRTSVNGPDNIGGYTQSGGTVNITGGNISTEYYAFSLTYPGNTFNMSGGTLRVAGAPTGGTTGGIFIASDESNQSITGGTVIMEINRNNDYKLTSNAPFWNVIMRKTSGSGSQVDLITGASGAGGNVTNITNPDLVVLNNLTIETGVTFDHNANDVTIGSDFTIQAGADYLYANGKPNTTSFIGTDNATLTFLNRTGGVNDEQRFYNFVMDRPSGKVLTLASGKADLTGNENNLLRIDGNHFKVLSGTLDQGVHSIRMYADTVVNYDQLTIFDPSATNDTDANGENDLFKLRDDGGAATVFITADTSRFGGIKLNSGSEIIDLISDLRIDYLEYRHGRMNLGTHNLKIDRLNVRLNGGETVGGNFSVEDMLITAGNSSDGGLSLRVNADGTNPSYINISSEANTTSNPTVFYFPIGTGTTGNTASSEYTPANIRLLSATDDGYITVIPVKKKLATAGPYPLGNNISDRYWIVNYSDFSTVPKVERMWFQSVERDDPNGGAVGFPANYVPGYVLETDPFTRTAEVNSGANSSSNIDNQSSERLRIFFWGNTGSGNPATGFDLVHAAYTAGDASKFVGAPTIYYSSTAAVGNNTETNNSDRWDQANRWSTVGHYSTVNSGTYPQGGDIAILGFGLSNSTATTDNNQRSHWYFVNQDAEAAKLIFADKVINANGITVPRSSSFQPQLIINNDNNLDVIFGTVEGNGAFNTELSCTSCNIDPSISNTVAANISGDFGAFAANPASRFDFDLYSNNNSSVFVPAYFPLIYPNVHLKGQGGNGRRIVFQNDITINRSLVIREGAYLSMSTTADGDISVGSDLNMTVNNDGDVIEFPNAGPGRTLTINGNINMDNPNDLIIVQDNNSAANVAIHRLRVGGNIVQDAGRIDLYSNTGVNRDQVILEVFGDTNGTFTSTNRELELYRLVVNKGVNRNTSFTFDDDVSLNGTTNGVIKALELQSGSLILNDANIDIDLTTGGDNFAISNKTALQLTQGVARVSGDNSGIALDGSIIIDGGTLDMNPAVGNGNNFIEYSASGNARIEISDGTLNIGSQLRPITTANTGVLKYIQTGGDVRIGTRTAPEGTRGMLQIYNNDSEFTFTGGTLTIERHQSTPTVAALYLDPDNYSITQPINIFNANTPAGQTNFKINSLVPLYDLVVNGNNSPQVSIDVNALEITNDLTIANNATFNGNGLTLTIGGDYLNDGTYNAQNNEIVFNSTTSQELSGGGTNDFFRFTKAEAGTLNLNNLITVNDLFTISDGFLEDNGNTISLKSDAVIDGTHVSSGGQGLLFNGSSAQELRRSTAGTGVIGAMSVNNSNGVSIPDGNGYNFNINGDLGLQSGVFYVGGSEVLFGLNAEIIPISAFSASNMIRTNSSFTDKGIGKVFAAGYNTNFIFPVGQSFYTPVTFNFGTPGNTSGSSQGTIFVNPANETHPVVTGNDILATGHVNNVLQYYWTLTASNVTNLIADVTFKYDDALVKTDEPGANYNEDDYIAARILSTDNTNEEINKFSNLDVDELTNTITFNFSSPGSASNGISGDYFAGLDEAIPDNVVTYIAANGGGDVKLNTSYDPTTQLPTDGVAPSGAVLRIPAGNSIVLNDDNIRLYKTIIEDGATLEVNNSTNHRLGILEGTGNLKITSDGINANLPAFSGDFLSCSGGGLEYAGTGNYSILPGIASVRNLILSDPTGTGVRNLPNNNVTICDNLIVDGPIVNNSNNKTIDVLGNTFLNNGVFNGGTGTINFQGNLELSGGTYNGQGGGLTNIFGKFLLNSGTFNSGTAGTIIFRGDIERTAGNFVTGAGTASNQIRGTTLQTITGDFTGANSFSRLSLRNSAGFIKTLGDMEASGTRLDFQDGILNMNGFDFNITTNNVFPNTGKSNSYINGNVTKEITNAGGSFTFPVGSNVLWRPATIKNVSAAGLTWEAQFWSRNVIDNTIATTADPTNPTEIKTWQLGEYWIISDEAGTPPLATVTANVGLSWGSETDVSSDPSERQELEVMVWNASSSSWDNKGGGNFSAGNSQSQGSLESTSLISFSENIFVLGSGDVANPLPVELVSFTAEAKNGIVQLDWVTASEKDNDFFEIERSFDGESFETIGVVEGNGTVQYEIAYDFIDMYPLNGKSFYRLKQHDYDGNFEYSPIVSINIDVASNLRLFPNPTTDQAIYLTLDGFHQTQPLHIKIINLQGASMFDQVMSPDDVYRKALPVKQSLKSGIYIIEVIQGNTQKQVRLAIH